MTRPNFTSNWIFSASKSELEIPAPEASVFMINQNDFIFRMLRAHVIGGKTNTFSIDVPMDGKEVLVERDGLRLRARMFWKGDILVFDSHVERGGEEGTNVVRYKLTNPPNSIIAEERFRSKSLNYDNVWVLDKQ